MTLKNRYVAAFKRMGWIVEPNGRTTKWTTMYIPGRPGVRVLIGMSGKVRQTVTGRMCDSFPIAEDQKARIKALAPVPNVRRLGSYISYVTT